MTEQIITIPNQPIENQNFFLNYNNINNLPIPLNTYVLKNISNVDVSDTFTVTSNGLIKDPIIYSLNSFSNFIRDSNNNFYFTNTVDFGAPPGNYNVYKLNINSYSPFISIISVFISYLDYPDLINSGPNGLAFDNNGFFYVALQGPSDKIKKFNPDGTGGIDFIVGGLLNDPMGIVFDLSGNLYVANKTSNSVLKYNSSGVYQLTISNPEFTRPIAIGINSLGELFVSNTTNGKLFQIVMPSLSVIKIMDIPIRDSANMSFDIGNNIGDGVL